MTKDLQIHVRRLPKLAGQWLKHYWRRGWWQKTVTVAVIITGLVMGTLYGIAQWYIHSQSEKPLQLGVTFVPEYARYLGVEPEETMDALIDELGVRQFRLVSYWNSIEQTPGQYDFHQLDWQFEKAEAAGAKVSLAIGLRQPRWPECHMPDWARGQPVTVWQPQLEKFIQAVVERYKDSPSLASYQLENEFFLKNFGICTNFDRQRLVSEFNLVSRLDPRHPIIVSRSDNRLAVPLGEPTGGVIGMSMYRRVWDAQVTKRYLTYPFPTWYYAALAGTEKILTGRDSVLHELQAEAWAPNGRTLKDISLAEQNKSMSAERLTANVNFAKASGFKHIDLFGAEYWYYRKQILDDPSLWDAARPVFEKNEAAGR